MKTYIILDNIRSAHNVGSIFRTADGAGVTKIFLTGYTPTPIDRFGRVREEIVKTSLGATESVPWEHVQDIAELQKRLQSEGISIVAIEQHPRAKEYRTFHKTTDTAFIFGNEIEGVSPELCESADVVLHIPMHGIKESLNVSVAAGIILFHTAL